jgi:hypothetical protein
MPATLSATNSRGTQHPAGTVVCGGRNSGVRRRTNSWGVEAGQRWPAHANPQPAPLSILARRDLPAFVGGQRTTHPGARCC